MQILILIILFNTIVLFIAFKTKRFLYTIPPEEQWKDELDKFDSNYKKLEELNIIDTYKLSSEHIY
ncbi:hypothetical protein [Winogradskyella sp. PG-2]|uniref:hypothetical protein n=1 Tax=Winogradskyella sp. PG-2 TaxID=754409 RepID=UPI000458770F|nr:hypothetical protein [Winogradskyella sp. PG-2]BAO77519.1 hypothetical protein WPG_3289 [Winogradskyella sp. PG-2]